MKKYIAVFMLFMFSFVIAQEKTYSIPESQLTQEQKQQLQKKQIVETVEQVSYFKGVGKEIGEAVSDGLSALNKEVNTFSESPAGKFTMFIIAYRVVGNDFIQFVIGIPLWLFGTLTLAYFYWRDTIPRKVLIKKEGMLWWSKKEWSLVNNDIDSDTKIGLWLAYGIYFVILSIVSGFVTFG